MVRDCPLLKKMRDLSVSQLRTQKRGKEKKKRIGSKEKGRRPVRRVQTIAEDGSVHPSFDEERTEGNGEGKEQ
jgi:hypothetical protein